VIFEPCTLYSVPPLWQQELWVGRDGQTVPAHGLCPDAGLQCDKRFIQDLLGYKSAYPTNHSPDISAKVSFNHKQAKKLFSTFARKSIHSLSRQSLQCFRHHNFNKFRCICTMFGIESSRGSILRKILKNSFIHSHIATYSRPLLTLSWLIENAVFAVFGTRKLTVFCIIT